MLRHALLLLALASCVLGARLPMRRLVHSGKWLGAAGGRIVGGQDAVPGQFPYQVSLQYVTWEFTLIECTGSLITPMRVLTAGHCCGATNTAVAGVVDLDGCEEAKQESKVLDQIYHPDFPVGYYGIYANDIAVFTLETAFTLNEYVQTIPLATAGSIPTVNSSAVGSAWGSSPDNLQWVELSIIDYETCRQLVDDLGVIGENFVVDTMVCTVPITDGVGLCSGDSGGPLVQDGALIGIAQWSNVESGKGGVPSGFNRVSAFIDFINAHI
uniref:Chymotrypsin 8 n=1 Tax=Locusta migratoria TaxID=7004 RepID=X5MFH7_LOCMI|nr:TPA_exp: chymotrypsin 8 [Locusta migratoria]